jgi:hypothetical protein
MADGLQQKSEWENKVFDQEIVGKWREEACKHHDDIEDVYLSKKMFTHVRKYVVDFK